MALDWSWSINDVLVLITWVVLVVVALSSFFVYVVKPSPRKSSGSGSSSSSTSSSTFADILPRRTHFKDAPGSARGTGAESSSKSIGNNNNRSAVEDEEASESASLLGAGGNKQPSSSNSYSSTVPKSLQQQSGVPSRKPVQQGNTQLTATVTGAGQVGSTVNPIGERALGDTLKSVLAHGMVITMHTVDGPKQITLTLANNGTELQWKSVKMFSRRSYKLALQDVISVEYGKKTNIFLRNESARNVSDDLCLSVVTDTHTLDLEAATKVERDVFAEGLTSILNAYKQKSSQV
jgi:hypothetical protein